MFDNRKIKKKTLWLKCSQWLHYDVNAYNKTGGQVVMPEFHETRFHFKIIIGSNKFFIEVHGHATEKTHKQTNVPNNSKEYRVFTSIAFQLRGLWFKEKVNGQMSGDQTRKNHQRRKQDKND